MKRGENSKEIKIKAKMAPQGQQSERRLARMSQDNQEANWNGQTDGRTDRQAEKTTY